MPTSSSASSSDSTAPSIRAPFSQSWIQALTAVADHPLARTIKPKLDLINSLALARDDVDRVTAANQLWDLAQSQGLTELLGVLPIAQANWVFDSDDIFLYHRAAECSQVSLAQRNSNWDCQAWQEAAGVVPTQVALAAEVFGGDWAGLVRKEAVRLQQAFRMSSVEQATTVRLAATALWDTSRWMVRFDQVPWVVVSYDDIPSVPRPQWAALQELLLWLLCSAAEATIEKKNAKCDYRPQPQGWVSCVEPLTELHQAVWDSKQGFSLWLVRVWDCVWPIVYREQHVLRERADIEYVRRELKICLEAQPRLCLWMFVFAKLVCLTQLGTGLGFCADYHTASGGPR